MIDTLFRPLLAATLLSACATDTSMVDEQSGMTEASPAIGVFAVRFDREAPQCFADGCPQFRVALLNESQTRCTRGAPQPECAIDELDWSPTGIGNETATMFEAMIVKYPTSVLLQGELVPAPDDAGLRLVVHDIWHTGTWGIETKGLWVLAQANAIECVKAPCPTISETRLNSDQQVQLTDLDFGPSHAEATAVERAWDDLWGPGVIIVGERFTDETGVMGRTANAFYLREILRSD